MGTSACEVCGTQRSIDAPCPVCGTAAEAASAPRPQAPPATSPADLANHGAVFEGQATTELAEPNPPTPARAAPGRSRTGLAVGVGVVLALVLGFVAFQVAGGSSSSDGASAPADVSTARPTSSADTGSRSSGVVSNDETVELSGFLVLDHEGVHVVEEGGDERTTIIGHQVSQAYDDGAGGLIYQEMRSVTNDTGTQRTADEWALMTDPPDSQDEATIWHLPAGASKPVPLLTSKDFTHSWPGLAGAGTLGGRRVVVYGSVRHDPDLDDETMQTVGDMRLVDLESGKDQLVLEWAWGWETSSSPVLLTPDRIAWNDGYAEPSLAVRDADLNPVSTACANPDDETGGGCGSWLTALDDSGQLVSLQTPLAADGSGGTVDEDSDVTVTDIGTGKVLASFPLSDDPRFGTPVTAGHLEARDGIAVLSFPSTGDEPAPVAQRYDLSAAGGTVPTPLDIVGIVKLLGAPLVRPADQPESAAPDPATSGGQSPASKDGNDVPDLSGFTGEWYQHSGLLTIRPDGTGSIEVLTPTMDESDDPDAELQARRLDGGSLVMAVVSSEDPSFTVGQELVFTVAEPGLTWTGWPYASDWCNEAESSRGTCGA